MLYQVAEVTMDRLASVDGMSGQHFEQNDAQRPDVTFF